MASSSSSSSSNNFTPKKYDVFLNFRSDKVNKNFVSNLYAALHRKNIYTYVDLKSQEQEAGKEEISESKLFIVIFSENYASSPKCLDELVYVFMKCNTNQLKQELVIPVFYHVDQSHVREQLGKMVTLFEPDRVDEWRRAFEAAATNTQFNFTSSIIKSESELVELLVEDVLSKLNKLKSLDNKESEYLVGIESRVEKIISLLRIGSPEVRIIGILGAGGIGKTTLARVVYERVASQFESSCFLGNVDKVSNSQELINLGNKLIGELFEEESLSSDDDQYSLSFGSTLSSSIYSKDGFRRKRVLTVLDDVNNSNQFEFLSREHDLFGYGSRIIVTTRSLQVLKNIGANEVYQVENLNYEEALQLFRSIASRERNFSEIDYTELSKEIVEYVQGLPLALKVLASCLKYKSKQDWEKALAKLRRIPNIGIQNVVKISFDELDDNEKGVFLDTACFFRNKDRETVENILDGRDFSTSNVVNDLKDKFLLTFDANNHIKMHDLIVEMAREIVRRDTNKRSRLLTNENILHIFEHNTESAALNVEGICLDMSEIGEVQLNKVFKSMRNLRLLEIRSSTNTMMSLQSFSEQIKSVRYLYWEEFPLTSLAEGFSLKNLVELVMPYSNLEKMWDGVQDLVNLRKIDLSYSVRLTHIPSLIRAPNLESINLEHCRSLTEASFHLEYLPKLTTLDISGCSSIHKFPQLPRNLQRLHMSGTNIHEVPPSSIESLTCLQTLLLANCKRLERLSPSSFEKFISLQYLNLNGCTKLSNLPEIFEPMKNLEHLYLRNTAIRDLPSSIAKFPRLKTLELQQCRELELIPKSICQLEKLVILNVSGCMKLNALPPTMSVGLKSLSRLNLSNCSLLEIPEQLGLLASLESLDLSGSIIDRVPGSISKLLKLKQLDISNCKNLRALPEIPLFIEFVDAHGCTSLKTMSTVSKLALTQQGWDHFPVRSEELVFLNCLRLDHNARNNLINEARLRILRMATFSRSKQVPECSSVSICYPGNQIPKWFNYRRNGSSIHVKLPHQWRNSNFLGFSLCVVAAPFSEDNFHQQIHFHCELNFLDKNGNTHKCKSFLRGYNSQDNNDEDTSIRLRCLNSDHLFIWYDYGLYLHEMEATDTFSEAWFEFYAIDSWDRKVNSCVVEKCGIHLLYRQEAARFGFSTGLSEQSDAIIETYDNDGGGDDDDDIDDQQQSTEINRTKSNFGGCLWIISLIREFCELGTGKKSGYDEEEEDHVSVELGYRVVQEQANTSTFEKQFQDEAIDSMKLEVQKLNQKAQQILQHFSANN
ncbi:hypothetical protein CsatA_026925 [Cannabis sativa]